MILLLSILAGLAVYFFNPSPAITYSTGIVFGGLLTWRVFKYLGRKSKNSEFFQSVFKKMLSYYPKPIIITKTFSPESGNKDVEIITNILKTQMKFHPLEAKEAAEYSVKHGDTLEDRLKLALKYLDKVKVTTTVN